MTAATTLILDSLPEAVDYDSYRKMVHELASQGQTTGPNKTEALIEYTQLNDRRMKRWDKTLKITEEDQKRIASIDKKITFLVLTESWCGDAAPAMPVMNKIASLNPNISFKVLLRDEHTALMEQFLTNGGMSIPKLIVFDEEQTEVLGSWGPRPSKATALAEAYKEVHGTLTPEFKQDLQVWYNKDKGQNTVADILQLLPLE